MQAMQWRFHKQIPIHILLFVKLDFYISDPAQDSESDRHLED